MKQYFYISIHFFPKYEESLFTKQQDNLYINNETGELFCKRLLYDFGWGQESGFELLPHLPFESLIELVEQPMMLPQKKFLRKYTTGQIHQADVLRSNLYGAVAVIMQDYVEEFVDFLSNKVNTDYFSDSSIRDNFKCFSFDSRKARAEGKFPGGILTKSYEDIFNDCPKWNRISSEVISQIYR